MKKKYVPFRIAGIFVITLISVLGGINLSAQGGLESILVEKVSVSSEALENDPAIPPNSFSYRIFVDMDTAYELQAVFSLENHPLVFKTSTHFYNNADFGGTAGKDLLSALFATAPALAYDSYITLDAAANNKLGLMIEEDSLDGKADGFVSGTALPLQTVGEDFSIPFGTDDFSGTFRTLTGIYNVIGGEQGPASSNRVLIGQFTTDGTFSFELNIQIRSTLNKSFVQYVARDPQGSEIYFPGLSWPVNTPPEVVITKPASRTKINTGETLHLEATASDPDSVTSVKFLLNGIEIGTDTIAPFRHDWIAAGDTARFSAIASDSLGLSDTSAVVVVFIGSYVAPVVILSSPAQSEHFVFNQPVSVKSEASDADGQVMNVEFFADSVKIGEDNTDPYELNWTPEAQGDIKLYAVAMDNDSIKASSQVVEITVILTNRIDNLNGGEGMSVYPNPAEKSITLLMNGLQANLNYNFEIIGLNGQVYLKNRISVSEGSCKQKIDISMLPAGVYQIRVSDGNSVFLSGKLVKN